MPVPLSGNHHPACDGRYRPRARDRDAYAYRSTVKRAGKVAVFSGEELDMTETTEKRNRQPG
jgi:hypothetical protein